MVCDRQEARPFAVVISEGISFTKNDREITSLVPKKGLTYFFEVRQKEKHCIYRGLHWYLWHSTAEMKKVFICHVEQYMLKL